MADTGYEFFLILLRSAGRELEEKKSTKMALKFWPEE